ncbi:MAG: ABC transporter substrate-binding protein [Chloroflexota bacterium]
MNEPSLVSRRSALRLLGLGGAAALTVACSQAAAPAPTAPAAKPTIAPAAPTQAAAPAAAPTTAPAAKSAAPSTSGGVSDAEWAAVVDAARKEGVVTVATYAGGAHRKILEEFEAAYPGIKIEHSQFQSSSRDYVPRVLQEQKAGLYTWDVAYMPVQEMIRQMRPIGGIEPVRPQIVRADAMDDRGWLDSYELGYPDDERKWGYALTRSRYKSVYINTDLVKDGEVTKFADLMDPKWRGKIIAGDPRTKGSGFLSFTAIRVKTGGDAMMTQLIKEQELAVSLDARQLTEFMVRGRYAIGIGAVDIPILKDFMAQGLGQNLKNVPMVETDYVNASNKTMWFLKNAPHPSAAKVLMNWSLTKESGVIHSQQIEDNSRRADVPVFDESVALQKGVDYVFVDSESMLDEIERTQKIAKDLLN